MYADLYDYYENKFSCKKEIFQLIHINGTDVALSYCCIDKDTIPVDSNLYIFYWEYADDLKNKICFYNKRRTNTKGSCLVIGEKEYKNILKSKTLFDLRTTKEEYYRIKEFLNLQKKKKENADHNKWIEFKKKVKS